MAVNCIAKLENENTNVVLLQSNTEYSGSLPNAFVGAFYRFELTENETIYFTLRITPNTAQPINVVFTLYRKDGETFTNLGSSISDDFYNTFDYSATPAEYYICLATDWDVDYTLEADFTDYPFVVLAQCDAYSGSYMPPTQFAPRESICDSTVFYEIIEGTMPDGLEFSSSGIISGVPLEQDCELVSQDMPPSNNWWSEDEEKVRVATSNTHRVIIRAALVDSPTTYADRAFEICIHNNWDSERDHFMGLKDEWETEIFINPEDLPTLDPDRYTDKDKTPLELITEHKETACPVDEIEAPYSASLEEIQELLKSAAIIDAYQGLVEITDGKCVPCPGTQDSDPIIILTQIETVCEPCPDYIEPFELEVIPVSMCPTVEIEREAYIFEPKYVPGIPELCYPEIIRGMHEDKVCEVRPQCPSVDIYPKIEEPDNTLKSPCPPPCEEEI